MFLKSLSLRGFKSFADRTVLELEPGITVVVGPNGSGKSNIVDALTWVLGTHSAKSLRGAAMSDVIFAGSGGGRRGGRPALGRASVEITIDNAAGTLPIDFSEVTVGRAMFANGENRYTLNDEDCRLLDVQELLSDTGLGRENHTIVGQGQLDAVLNARPEDRRAFIEEAAGILKHRRRKERALRKLAATEAHVERLGDLLRELRRQLRPLERQAQAAQRHAEYSEALRQVRVTRATRELAALTARLAAEDAGGAASAAALAGVDAELAQARAAADGLERELARQAPVARAAAETHFRLAGLTERARGLVDRIAERTRGLAEAVEEPVAGRDPAELRERAEQARAQLAELADRHAEAGSALAAAAERRATAERARRAHEQAAAAEARRRAEARERVLRWEGARAALSSALTQAAGEQGRMASQVDGLAAQAADLAREVEEAAADAAAHDQEARRLAEAAEAARRVAEETRAALAAAATAERDAERAVARLQARAEALRAAAVPTGSGADALTAADLPGLLGPLAAAVQVTDGAAPAIAAALGPLAESLLATDPPAAAHALHHATATPTPRVTILPVASSSPVRETADLGDGVRPLLDLVQGDAAVVGALAPVLGRAFLVADLAAACALAERHPHLTFVTPSGEAAGAGGYAAGDGGADPVRARAEADAAEREARAGQEQVEGARRVRAEAEGAAQEASAASQAAAGAQREGRALARGAQERREAAGRRLAAAEREHDRLARQRDELDRQVAERRRKLEDLERQGPGASAPDDEGQGGDLEAERLDDLLAQAREAEVQARLALGAVEQQAGQLRAQVEGLEREADDVERRLVERERRREARLAALDRCSQLAVVAADALARAQASLDLAATEREVEEERRGALQRDLGALRARLRELETTRGEAVAARHAEDLRRQELRHAVDGVRTRMADDLGADPDEALAAAAQDDGTPDEELAEQEEALARKLGLLGSVNHLAAQEFEALQERHAFLEKELDDLRTSRRDLAQVINAVDDRIREVFAAAFTDVAEQFARLFPRLFPGGEGGLILTDPDDLLETGIEVEARPAGKRVKRLSLLSGGERSLTALAVLFAIFAARPSPFYVLDEVEAALDDVNLQRFLDVLLDFKSHAQLIVVTHQRRTMEIADTLYGVSMRDDGVSRVVSQRLTDTDLRVETSDEVRL